MAGSELTKSELTRLIDAVRLRARPALSQYAHLSVDECTESYLFKRERFCGLKIILGEFHARWALGNSQIIIERGSHFIQALELDGRQQQRVA